MKPRNFPSRRKLRQAGVPRDFGPLRTPDVQYHMRTANRTARVRKARK